MRPYADRDARELFYLRSAVLKSSGRREQAIAELRGHLDDSHWWDAREIADLLAEAAEFSLLTDGLQGQVRTRSSGGQLPRPSWAWRWCRMSMLTRWCTRTGRRGGRRG